MWLATEPANVISGEGTPASLTLVWQFGGRVWREDGTPRRLHAPASLKEKNNGKDRYILAWSVPMSSLPEAAFEGRAGELLSEARNLDANPHSIVKDLDP